MKARTNWNQEEKGGGDEYTNKDEGESIHAHTRDEQSKRAVSMENMDEGRKHALTGDEEMSSRGGNLEEQRISMLGNSKFNVVTWCRSFNGL